MDRNSAERWGETISQRVKGIVPPAGWFDLAQIERAQANHQRSFSLIQVNVLTALLAMNSRHGNHYAEHRGGLNKVESAGDRDQTVAIPVD
jgi:hypothetical protein